MSYETFLILLMAVSLAMSIVGVGLIWYQAVQFFRDGEHVFGLILGAVALVLTFLVLALFGLVFGWDWPVQFGYGSIFDFSDGTR